MRRDEMKMKRLILGPNFRMSAIRKELKAAFEEIKENKIIEKGGQFILEAELETRMENEKLHIWVHLGNYYRLLFVDDEEFFDKLQLYVVEAKTAFMTELGNESRKKLLKQYIYM